MQQIVAFLWICGNFLAEKHTSCVFSLTLRRKNTLRKIPGISQFHICVYANIFLLKNTRHVFFL